GLQKTELKPAVQSALKEAKRYPTQHARQAVAALEGVLRLLPSLPDEQALDNVATPEEVESAEAPAPVETAPQPALEVKDTGTRQLEKTLVYVLFAVYLIAVVAFGFILAGLYRRRLTKVKNHVAELERRLGQLDFGQQDPQAYTQVVQEDLKRRWERLENNTVEFIGKVEEELKALREQVQAKAVAPSQLALEQRLVQLEARLAAGKPAAPVPPPQQPAHPTPTPGDALPPAIEPVSPPAGPDTLLGQVQAAVARLGNDAAWQELIQNLLQAEAGATQPNTRKLAQLVQAVYAQLPELYPALLDRVQTLGMVAEDQMVGRMGFSDFYAENLPLDRFRLEEENILPGVQNASILKQAEAQPVYSKAVKNTVLLTLRPTMLQVQEGAKTVLSRGLYVVLS
ncbi:MAG: hypothetical protein ACK5P1_11990, partial [Sphingobacteriia bacterium]